MSDQLLAISRAERSVLAAPTPEMAKHYDEEIVDGRKTLLSHVDQFAAIATASTASAKQLLLSRRRAAWEKYVPLQDKFIDDLVKHDRAFGRPRDLSYGTALKQLVD